MEGWHDLTVELQDIILQCALHSDGKEFDAVRELAFCFVCRRWKERMPFWQSKEHRDGSINI